MSKIYEDPTKEDAYEEYLRIKQNQANADAEKAQMEKANLLPKPTIPVDPLKYEFPTQALENSGSEVSKYGLALASEERQRELEAEEGGIGAAILDTVEFVASPFMAFGDAILAPVAAGTETLSETASVSWNAFKSAMMPTYGADRPEYGKMAAKRLGIDEKWGLALEILTDPTLLVGGGAMKLFQKGLRSTAKVAGQKALLNKAGKSATVVKALDEAGPWRRGLEEFLGASRPALEATKARVASLTAEQVEDVSKQFTKQLDEVPVEPVLVGPMKETVGPLTESQQAGKVLKDYREKKFVSDSGTTYTAKEAIELTKRADLGDKEAMNELVSALNKDPELNQYARGVDTQDEVALLRQVESSFGDFNVNEFEFEGGNANIAAELLVKSANSNKSVMKGRINLAKSYTGKDGSNNIVRRMEEIFSEQFDKITKTVSNSDTVIASQKVQLQDLMGMKVTEMGPKEAYVLRQSLIASADNLYEAAQRATNKFSGPLDEVAFDKALAFHTYLQHKAKGAATHAGRLLQSYNITATTNAGRLAEINDLLGATKLC